MIPQEIIQNTSDGMEGYLLLRQWLDDSNGKVSIATRLPTHSGTRHWTAARDHDTLESPRKERLRINKPERHFRRSTGGAQQWRRGRNCKSGFPMFFLLLPLIPRIQYAIRS